jgi:hypothetical protein
MEEQHQDNSRRKFLKAGIITTAVAAGGLAALEVLSQDKNKKTGDTVKLLSPDGKIVEVDSSEINPQIPEYIISDHNVREVVPGKIFQNSRTHVNAGTLVQKCITCPRTGATLK